MITEGSIIALIKGDATERMRKGNVSSRRDGCKVKGRRKVKDGAGEKELSSDGGALLCTARHCHADPRVYFRLCAQGQVIRSMVGRDCGSPHWCSCVDR